MYTLNVPLHGCDLLDNRTTVYLNEKLTLLNRSLTDSETRRTWLVGNFDGL